MPFLSENRVSILALLRGVTGFRLVLPGLLSLALALPVQAECSWDISPALSPRAVEFIALATQSAGDTSIAEELLGLQLDIRCGDADAIAAIKPFLQQPDTTLVASAMLVDAGHLDALELFGAIRNTPITLERKADLFQLAVDWISRSSTKTSAEIIARRTAWAMASGNEKLIRLAHELRAAHGDEAAAAARATRLMACAEDEDGGVGFDCLGMHELHTGALAEIEPRWNNASMAQRIWLARWARPTHESHVFFVTRLLSEEPRVQFAILTEALEGGNTREFPIVAARHLLEQAATHVSRRPPAVAIDFSRDYREGMFGIAAYEPGENYPLALNAAFDELTTYPDAADVMESLVVLDHPWLATQAGMWLVRHGQAETPMHALRYTLEDDGLPPQNVLARVLPSGDGISLNVSELFRLALETGDLGKWRVFAESPFEELLHEPAIAEAVIARIDTLPQRVADAGIDVTLDETLRIRLQDRDDLEDELDAFGWVGKASKNNLEFGDRYIEAFRALDAPIWKAVAMMAAMELDQEETAKAIAWDLIDAPIQGLRVEARKLLEVGE